MRKKRCRRETGAESISESIGRCFDLPQDALGCYAHIEISGNSEVLVDGCQGVLEYGDCTVALNTGRLTVRICGGELTVVSMQNGQAIIKGVITSVEFCN